MDGIERFQNTSGGLGYIYFNNTVDFAPITQLSGITSIFCVGGANTFNGGNLAETLEGGAGDDFFYGNGGKDILFGDTNAADPIGDPLATGYNKLFGGAGNDTLNGQSGNDVVDDGIGTNTLTGGSGNRQPVHNIDRRRCCNPDFIQFSLRLILKGAAKNGGTFFRFRTG